MESSCPSYPVGPRAPQNTETLDSKPHIYRLGHSARAPSWPLKAAALERSTHRSFLHGTDCLAPARLGKIEGWSHRSVRYPCGCGESLLNPFRQCSPSAFLAIESRFEALSRIPRAEIRSTAFARTGSEPIFAKPHGPALCEALTRRIGPGTTPVVVCPTHGCSPGSQSAQAPQAAGTSVDLFLAQALEMGLERSSFDFL